MRIYLFVDAENHYRRSIEAITTVVGSAKAAQAFAQTDIFLPGNSTFPPHVNGKRYGWNESLQLFWDCDVFRILTHERLLSPARAIYFCSCTGDEEDVHGMQVGIRQLGFEPVVVKEQKNHFRQRAGDFEKLKLIDKAKGCDIALATRMVSDAASDRYDACCLFTSDIDFLPAVEAARRLGKVVTVAGYRSALGKRSPYLFVPDRFLDLEAELTRTWQQNWPDISKTLASLGETSELNKPK